MHSFFHCPHIIRFWSEVCESISSICSVNFPYDVHSIFLGSNSVKWFGARKVGLFVDLLIAIAFQIITSNWKDASKVSHSAWWNLLCYHHRLDRASATTAQLLIRKDLFWSPLTNYLCSSVNRARDNSFAFKPPWGFIFLCFSCSSLCLTGAASIG